MNLAHRPTKILVTGASGTGKSTFATRYLVNAKYGLKFVFDHELEFAYRSKLTPSTVPEEMADQVRTGWVIYDPDKMFPGEPAKAFEFFAEWALAVSQSFAGKKLLFCDEFQLFCEPHAWPPALARLIQTGRRYELDFLACSQQANELNNRLRQQLTEVVSFRQNDRRALEWLDQAGLPSQELAGLPPGSFLDYDRVSRVIQRGKVF